MSNPIVERLWLYRIRSKKDAQAFGALYDRYVTRMYRFVLFKVRSEDDAKEITSDVFFKAWEYITAGKQVTNLVGLLYQMARTAIIDHYRKTRLETVSLEQVPDIPDLRDLKEQVLITKDLETVLEGIKTLKDEYREALLMRHIDGMSMGEIAAAMGKNTGTVRVLLHRATHALKELLQ